MTRRGATLVETLVVGGLLALVLGGLWAFASGLRRGETGTTRAVDLLADAVTLRARLAADLYAARVPSGVARTDFFPELRPDGRRMGWARTASLAGSSEEDVYVRWSLEGPEGEGVVVREVLGPQGAVMETRRFETLRVLAGRFSRRDLAGEVFAIGELLLAPAGEERPTLPVRLVAPLRPPARVAPGLRAPFPEQLLGEPPEESP